MQIVGRRDLTLPPGGSRGTSGEGESRNNGPDIFAALPGRYRVRPSQREGEAAYTAGQAIWLRYFGFPNTL
jgi:hypothetical protein